MSIARIIRVVSFVTMIVSALSVTAQTRGVKTPDFAYPQTVSADARKSLDKALTVGDAQGVLRSLMDYTLAQGATGASNLPGCIALIDSVGKTEAVGNDAVLGSMLPLLKAAIYNNIYTSQRWKYDNRASLSLLPIPEDYTEWSGAQFRHVITGLIDIALADSAALRAVPLKKYAGVITQDRMTAVYYPTLYNFAARQAIDILQGFTSVPHIFAEWMAIKSANSLAPFNAPALSRDSIGERILAIYGSVIDSSPRGSAPAVNARLERLEFLQNHTADNMLRSSYSGRGLLLKDLYRSYLAPDGNPVTEYAGDILLAIPVYDTDRRELYDMMTSFLSACPSYWRKDCIRQTLRNMEQKTVSLSTPRVVAPGAETMIEAVINNVTRMSVDIYDVSSAPVDIEDFTFSTGMAGVRKVASLPVEVKGERVPFEAIRKVSYTFATPGNYIAVPTVAGAPVRRDGTTKIHVTRLALASTQWPDRNVWAIDPADGKPLPGVTVSVNPAPYRKGSVAKRVGVTDSIGSVKVPDKNGVAIAASGNDKYAMPLYLHYYNYDRPDKWIMRAQGYPSLPLYHPSDSMEWVAVCYEYKGGLNRPYDNKEVTAVLYDANRMPVDTLLLVTDRFGRVSGGFRLPDDGLTGQFSVAVDDTRYALGFEVSDYKLPSFRVEQPKAEQNAPAIGDVTIRGHVETYAGFPLTNVEVTLSLSVTQRPRWWYPSPSYDDFCVLTARTDTSGDYEIVIDKNVFASSPVVGGYYTANISVLSSTGETQTAAVSFGQSERYVIKASVPNEFDLTRDALPVEARVVNYEDSIVAGGVEVELVRPDSVIATRTHIDNKGTINVAGMQQGTYRLIMSRENADTVTREVVLYDPTASESPCPDVLLWAPKWRLTVGERHDNTWIYAVNCDSHLLVTLWTTDGIISQRWEKARKGFNRLAVTLPDGVDDATLSILATGGYRQQCGEFNITRADSERGLKIIAESFRDRLVPGEEETWTFRVVDLRGNGREAAVITDMYNTALDVLAKTNWTFAAQKGYMPGFSMSLSPLSSLSSFYLSAPAVTSPRLKCPEQVMPSFNTYGRSWNSYMFGRVMVRGLAANAKMAMTDKAEDEMVVEEAMDYVTADAGAAAPMYNSAAKGMELSESAVMVSEDGLDEDGKADSHTAGDSFSYRDSEVSLALFRPALVTDKEGRVALTFTVPDANTTWGVRVLAFTDSLLSATLARDVVASKDIMVKPNLPRFVRTGDRVVIQASVMNATDAEQIVDTEVELFNPTDNTRLMTLHRPDTIAPNGSAMVEVEFAVPSGMSFIGYRIKSSTATRADGEQALIPVLPSVTPVIDTYPFYMGADTHELSMRMPDIPATGQVTLQFCENPAWYVVTALPGLLNNESSTAPDAARAIYSAAIARGLLRDNPAIADALREWSESDRSSQMLTSMLERNAELKSVLLGATPWMLDARNDTERMTRLSLLFDRKLVDKTINDNIALLSKLAVKGGGWSWCASYPEPSRWATHSVLEYLGRLVRLGFLPDDSRLTAMLTDALSWDTKTAREEFSKYPDSDFTRYVYLHDLYESMKFGAPDASIVNSTTQRILRDWKNATLAVKAIDAQILFRHNYRNVAGEILASIRQFAETSGEKGMWFPSLNDAWYGNMDKIGITAFILETFNLVEPACPEVDMLRQWLILQKGAQNWGSGTTASYVVGAVLSTSSSWVVPAQGATVRMGRTRVEPKPFERLTGEFEASLPANKVSGKTLKIERRADTPSWGAVYCRYQSDMTDVKPAACPELSIVKSIPDTVRVGDRVTVRLTLKADADMDYVVITDDRPACYEPVEQLPGPVFAEGLRFYRENLDSSTRIFIDRLPKGTYILTYDMWVNNAGEYTSGIATAQSQYAPRFTAHSGGKVIICNPSATK